MTEAQYVDHPCFLGGQNSLSLVAMALNQRKSLFLLVPQGVAPMLPVQGPGSISPSARN